MQKKRLTKVDILWDKYIKLSIERTYHNMIKAIYFKPIVDIIFNDKKLKTFSLRLGIRLRTPSIATSV